MQTTVIKVKFTDFGTIVKVATRIKGHMGLIVASLTRPTKPVSEFSSRMGERETER